MTSSLGYARSTSTAKLVNKRGPYLDESIPFAGQLLEHKTFTTKEACLECPSKSLQVGKQQKHIPRPLPRIRQVPMIADTLVH